MELTQECFDKGIINLQNNLERYVDKKTAVLASKADLAGQTKELKQYTNDAFSAHQELMEAHLKAIRADLDVRRNVERLERDMEKLKKALAGQGSR